MALTNFSLPFGALSPSGTPWSATVPPLHPIHQQLAANTNNLLYSPADHQPQQSDNRPPPPGSDFYKNNPYAPPQQTPQQTSYQYNNNNSNNGRRTNTYLPPIPSPGSRNSQQQFHSQQQQQFQHHQQPQQFSHINTHHQQQVAQNINSNSNSDNNNNNNNNNIFKTAIASSVNSNTRSYGEGTYTRFPQASLINNINNNDNNINNDHHQQQQQQQQHQQTQYFNSFPPTSQHEQQTKHINTAVGTSVTIPSPPQTFPKYGLPNQVEAPAATYGAVAAASASPNKADSLPTDSSSNDPYPERPPGFTRVQAGQGSKTRVHAVLDYDLEEGEEEEDDYYDAQDHAEAINKDGSPKTSMNVTPIQGPIYLKNGTVPVVPLFHYPSFNNGSFVQIPIWWTALSVALGLDVRGDLIKGVPCIKRYHQLFCPTAGNSYPIDKIERFIDDNKALMRRMYGDFEIKISDGSGQQTTQRKRRFIDEPDIFLPPGVYPTFVPDDKVGSHAEEHGESYFGKLRNKRQTNKGNRNAKQTQNSPRNGSSSTGRLDACESKVEIVTPYWASNSAGKIRAIVNTQHFEQAIHQEICSKAQTSRCQGECGCEQKYKWHRLLSYDPDNDCKGIFMDWFLFPSCCVCRCNP